MVKHLLLALLSVVVVMLDHSTIPMLKQSDVIEQPPCPARNYRLVARQPVKRPGNLCEYGAPLPVRQVVDETRKRLRRDANPLGIREQRAAVDTGVGPVDRGQGHGDARAKESMIASLAVEDFLDWILGYVFTLEPVFEGRPLGRIQRGIVRREILALLDLPVQQGRDRLPCDNVAEEQANI